MKNYNSKFLGISGIVKELPENLNQFREFKVENIIKIDNDRKNISDLLSATVKIENVSTEIFNTIQGTSCDDSIFTGKKILINGNTISNYKYTINNYSKSIYNARFENFFSTYVALHKEFNIDKEIIPSVYIEDIKISVLDKNHICESILMLVNIDIV